VAVTRSRPKNGSCGQQQRGDTGIAGQLPAPVSQVIGLRPTPLRNGISSALSHLAAGRDRQRRRTRICWRTNVGAVHTSATVGGC